MTDSDENLTIQERVRLALKLGETSKTLIYDLVAEVDRLQTALREAEDACTNPREE